MPKNEIARFLTGFRQFREKFYSGEDPAYTRVLLSQAPKTLIIGCSDSRVDPAVLSASGPGELFVVRNIANLVPPYEHGGGYHGVSSAIEYAVVNLKVEYVVIMGHRQCGGIRGLLFPQESNAGEFVQNWMKLAQSAKLRSVDKVGLEDSEALCRECERESIRTSLENLRTFPFVQEAITSRELKLIGMYFDLEKGEMLVLDEGTGTFSPA